MDDKNDDTIASKSAPTPSDATTNKRATGTLAPIVPAELRFDHHRLDAFHVALGVMVAGTAIAKKLPQGYGKLRDQLERALIGAFTQTTEASARTGSDRVARFRAARGEASEAAGLLEGIVALGVVGEGEVRTVMAGLWRLCAMLTRLGGYKR
jgi:hypothetical protein